MKYLKMKKFKRTLIYYYWRINEYNWLSFKNFEKSYFHNKLKLFYFKIDYFMIDILFADVSYPQEFIITVQKIYKNFEDR